MAKYGVKTGRTIGDEARDEDMVMDWCRRISREILESVYIWDSEGDRNRDLAGVGDKVE